MPPESIRLPALGVRLCFRGGRGRRLFFVYLLDAEARRGLVLGTVEDLLRKKLADERLPGTLRTHHANLYRLATRVHHHADVVEGLSWSG